jgi:hypothetical protein
MILRVIIRDDSPMFLAEDGPTYRSVAIELTPEQAAQIRLRKMGHARGVDIVESVSKCFLEEDKP